MSRGDRIYPAPASELMLVCLTLSLAFACSHAPAADTGPALGERFWLRAGESVAIRGERATVPSNGSSRTAAARGRPVHPGGRGASRFPVGDARGDPVTFELDTDRERNPRVGGYVVTLDDVSPLPVHRADRSADYRAEITVPIVRCGCRIILSPRLT